MTPQSTTGCWQHLSLMCAFPRAVSNATMEMTEILWQGPPLGTCVTQHNEGWTTWREQALTSSLCGRRSWLLWQSQVGAPAVPSWEQTLLILSGALLSSGAYACFLYDGAASNEKTHCYDFTNRHHLINKTALDTSNLFLRALAPWQHVLGSWKKTLLLPVGENQMSCVAISFLWLMLCPLVVLSIKIWPPFHVKKPKEMKLWNTALTYL